MDFYRIMKNELKNGTIEIYPDWIIGRSKDLMVRGRGFYAVWDEEANLWSTDEYDVQRLVDADLHRYNAENGNIFKVKSLGSFSSKAWVSFRQYMQSISDNHHPLDANLTFANSDVKKTDYVSRRLPYSLEPGDISAWDELLGVLYSPEERAKIEWAIGAIVAGEAKHLQKFLVFYGPAGSGKSTVLNIIQDMFAGYTVVFDAKALGSSNNAFATEVFKSNPLVAIQHDGDLSKIDDNTKLNSIISHEEITMNEKYKSTYSSRVNAFLFMGTNQPVKITDAKSGIIRRLIDVHPTGSKIEAERYQYLMSLIKFELGAIAYHCQGVFNQMGRNYYNSYKPLEMMLQTDVFYNYIEYYFDVFKSQEGITLKQAYSLYREFCSETGIDRLLPQYKFREELRNYFDEFKERAEVDGSVVRSYYKGFKNLKVPDSFVPDPTYSIVLDKFESALDRNYKNKPAQYSTPSGHPRLKWDEVKSTLADLDTSKLHFVKIPKSHIVIDFDLVDDEGEKSLERNLEAAAKWPPTYTELSKSGKGVHLHYVYNGDVTELSSVYDVGIEVKTLLGNSALRRKLTLCNNLDMVTISGGLPTKEKPAVNNKTIQSEKGLRVLIERNLRKEIHPGTKPSIDFIHKILEEAYDSGMVYDLRDMRGTVLTFALKSTNQAETCIKTVQKMKFVGQNEDMEIEPVDEAPVVFFDVEVYENLFLVCWKYIDAEEVVRMINPTPSEIEKLFSLKLVGFNNRRYDNHILYARYLGYTNEELYALSQKIINTSSSAMLFGEAYNLSYADIYDFSSKKQGLKKFQIELGIYHMELDIPWDEPVPEDKWPLVEKYCVNDVLATEAVFKNRAQDFVARQLLAEVSGLKVNDTTQQHTARIIFGNDRTPQDKFNYTDLSKEFPGYKFDQFKRESTYRGEITGEGGYVYAEPGGYENVVVLDVASMHPTSICELDLFGPYTQNFKDLMDARLAIKHKNFKELETLMDGRLKDFANVDDDAADALSYALKIVINTVYGLTSARFPNAFKDNRNVDNIVAKRGALFMIDLKHAVQNQGFDVVHIKTDSIKIPNATQEIIDFVSEFGQQYGYTFEHEATYDKFCLVNDAVYIAREGDKWTAVGAQFQHPYIFKTLFTHEDIKFEDLCETRSVVQGAMYLDFSKDEDQSELVYVGRTGSFVPVKEKGGRLLRIKDDKSYAVTGTKGYRWMERTSQNSIEPYEDKVDFSYFEKLKDDAMAAIDYYTSIDKFLS